MLIIYSIILSLLFQSNLHDFKEGKFSISEINACGVDEGFLEIRNVSSDSFEFLIDVKNSSNLSTGSIQGLAEIAFHSHTAYFQHFTEDVKETIRTYLTFSISPDGKYIFISGERTFLFHGVSICFDGYYLYN